MILEVYSLILLILLIFEHVKNLLFIYPAYKGFIYLILPYVHSYLK